MLNNGMKSMEELKASKQDDDDDDKLLHRDEHDESASDSDFYFYWKLTEGEEVKQFFSTNYQQ